MLEQIGLPTKESNTCKTFVIYNYSFFSKCFTLETFDGLNVIIEMI